MCARLHACGFYAVSPFPPAPPSSPSSGRPLANAAHPPSSSSSSAAPKVLKRTRLLFLQAKQNETKIRFLFFFFFLKKGRFHPAFPGWFVCFFKKQKQNSFATYLYSFPERVTQQQQQKKQRKSQVPPQRALVLRPYLTARAAPCKAADLSLFFSLKQPQ